MSSTLLRGPHRTASLPVTADTPKGKPVVVGSLVGVTLTDEGKGNNPDGYATVALDGRVELPVSTTSTVAVGGPVYVTSGYVLTPSSSGNTLFGYAITAKGATANQVIQIEIAQV